MGEIGFGWSDLHSIINSNSVDPINLSVLTSLKQKPFSEFDEISMRDLATPGCVNPPTVRFFNHGEISFTTYNKIINGPILCTCI